MLATLRQYDGVQQARIVATLNRKGSKVIKRVGCALLLPLSLNMRSLSLVASLQMFAPHRRYLCISDVVLPSHVDFGLPANLPLTLLTWL